MTEATTATAPRNLTTWNQNGVLFPVTPANVIDVLFRGGVEIIVKNTATHELTAKPLNGATLDDANLRALKMLRPMILQALGLVTRKDGDNIATIGPARIRSGKVKARISADTLEEEIFSQVEPMRARRMKGRMVFTGQSELSPGASIILLAKPTDRATAFSRSTERDRA